MQEDQIGTPRARIAWLSPDSEAFARAVPQFEKAGYALADGAAEGPSDIAVVDFRGRRVTARAAQQLAALMRRKSPECGIVYLGAPLLGAAERAHLRRSGDLVLVEENLRPAIETCRQRMRIRNVAEEAGERLKSIAASTRLSEFPPIETSSAAPSVLVAGAPGAAALSAFRAVEAIGDTCAGALSAGQAMRALEAASFDCAVFLTKSDGDPLMSLAKSMRRHRRFQDLPIVMIAVDDAARGRIAAVWGAETLLSEHIADDLGPRVVSLARRARLMAAMRRFLAACAGEGVRDRLSGAFAPQFFGQHAQRVFARQAARPISLVGLRLQPLTPETSDCASAKTLTEAARLINRVTRAEDCVGRLTNDTFVALMTSTNAHDGAIAARRIEGVISNTMFRSRSKQSLFAVATATACVERSPGAGIEETVAAVMAKLNTATLRTAER